MTGHDVAAILAARPRVERAALPHPPLGLRRVDKEPHTVSGDAAISSSRTIAVVSVTLPMLLLSPLVLLLA
jgi:hypothetical protein